MFEPRQIISGDTTGWTRVQPDFPASDGWSLTYYISRNADAPIVIVADPSGADFKVGFTPDWAPGKYSWVARVSKAEITRTVAGGTFAVLPDPSKPFDRRTATEQLLAAVDALLAKRIPESIVEFELYEGVKGKHLSHAELLSLQDSLRTRVRLERGGPLYRTIPIGRR